MNRFILCCFALILGAAHAASPKTLRPELALQTGHTSRVTTVALSADGTMAASGSFDKSVKIWDARNGDVLHSLEEPQPSLIRTVKFSPDGALLAVVASPLADDPQAGGNLKLYSTRSGVLIRSLPERARGAGALAFSPDGRWLATSGDESGVHLWDLHSGELVRNYKGHAGQSDALIFVNHGKNLLSISTRDQTICEWEVATSALLRSTNIEVGGDVRVAFSADGSLLAMGRPITRDKNNKVNGDVTICDARTGRALHVLSSAKDAVTNLAFAPDGKTLAATSYDGVLTLWNPQSGKLLKSIYGEIQRPASVEQGLAILGVSVVPTCATFSSDSRTLVVGSGNGGVTLHDMIQPAQPKLLRALLGKSELMQEVTFSADGRTWDSVSISPFEATGITRTWDAQSGVLLKSEKRGAATLRKTARSPDGAMLVSRVRGANANLVDGQTGKVLWPLKQSAGGGNFVFVNGGKNIVGSFGPKSLRVWDAASGEATLTTDIHKEQITDVGVSPDGSFLVSTDVGGTLLVWNARSDQPKLLRTISVSKQSSYITSVVISPDSSTLAAIGIGKVLICNAKKGAVTHTLTAHSGVIMGAAFSPDGQRLITCGDSTVKLWEVKSGRHLLTLYTFPPDTKLGTEEHLAVTPDGYYAGSAAADRYVRFRLGDTLYPAESFQARYYRPDLVKKSMAGEELPSVGDFKGPFPPVSKLGLAPTDKSSRDSVTVSLAATDDSEVKNVAFFINGARVDAKPLTAESRPLTAESRPLTADSRPLTADSRPLTADSRSIPAAHKTVTRYTATLPLPPGAANIKIQAIAFDDDGLQSPREEILFTRDATAAPQGRLLGLCVGVSQYQDARLNLKFADADANALSKTLGAQRGIYSEAKISALTNEKATAQEVKSQLDALIQSSTRADTVMFSLSGHGWRDDARNFYFATHEVNRNDVAKTALPWREITDRLTQLSQRSKRVVVLLDACHSGSAATNEELVKAILSANAGVLVFASSRGSEVSLENAEWGHGAFTKALIEAMEGKAAPDEKKVAMIDFIAYVSRRVKTLTQDQQHPQVPFLQDFDTDAALVARP